MGIVKMAQLYRRPHDYDLEHLNDREDVDFYIRLAQRLKPRAILELACGTGRITLPLAEEAARSDFTVVGLDSEPEMLAEAHEKRNAAALSVRDRLQLCEGDMRCWSAEKPFDLIIIPCGSINHALELDDQLATWRQAYRNLSAGGRFVIDTTMPNFTSYAESFNNPPRITIEVDRDIADEQTGIRLIRHRSITYVAESQRARVRFTYEKYSGDRSVERYLDDFESHVYFPRELELLFRYTGFEVEAIYGDYGARPLRTKSASLIMIGRKPM